MRYIAVFAKYNKPIGHEFDTLKEASEYLHWGYKNNDLIPYGLFGMVTNEVFVHDNTLTILDIVALIRKTASHYSRLTTSTE